LQQLLNSNLEVLVAGDFLYLPLLLDPSIAQEIQGLETPAGHHGPAAPNQLIVVNGQRFIKTLSLSSLVAAFEKLHPQVHARLREELLGKKLGFPPDHAQSSPDSTLKAIVLEVMPHFLRRKNPLAPKKSISRQEMLALIYQEIDFSADDADGNGRLADAGFFGNMLGQLEQYPAHPAVLEEGIMGMDRVHRWLRRLLQNKIVADEKARLARRIKERERFQGADARESALLLHLQDRGALEIGGVGFTRMGASRDYCLYKRTGEYALKDYFGRVYIFPDCRVAVYTSRRLKPVVLEKYKHPLLRRHAAGQHICLPNFQPPAEFTPAGAVAALEEGLNALFYGYNYRRRNGYHSLDRLPRQERLVDFEDHRVEPDDPRIASGKVEVKNARL
jgi:hypothetical protein